MPLEQFMREYDAAPFEWIDGEKRLLVPNVSGQGEVAKRVYGSLLMRELSDGHIVVQFELFYVMEYRSDWVTGSRVPDLMVYGADRMRAYKANTPDWEGKPFIVVPDLVIEVRSVHDVQDEVEDKIDLYLAHGVRCIWLIDPRQRRVYVYTLGSNMILRLNAGDALENAHVLSGFSVRVGDGDLFGG
jgi:hypothetical protein